MPDFQISYDFKAPMQFLTALEKRLSNKRDLLMKLAQIVTWNVRKYIEEGGTPEGKFDETGPGVVALEGKGHFRPLIWTGDLLRSITYVMSGDAAYVGSPLKYAENVRKGGFRQFRRKVYEDWGGMRWIPGGVVYENGIRYGSAGTFNNGISTGIKPWMQDYGMMTSERNYLVVTQQDADDLMSYLWKEVTGESA
jgi:phage gpG-like protein